MGREIRRVAPGWQHPTYKEVSDGMESMLHANSFHPIYNEEYDQAAAEWLEGCLKWSEGKHEDQGRDDGFNRPKHYWDWHGMPPDKSYYRHGKWSFKPEDATAFQIYETVSEGTPVSPVFETKDAMRIWLIEQGHSESSADGFINAEWAPSMIVGPNGIRMGIDAMGGDS